MQRVFILLKVSLLLTLLPASASAALIVSDWTATPTTLSFKITGTIEAGATIGAYNNHSLFVGPVDLPYDAGKSSMVDATITSLGGSPTGLAYAFISNEVTGVKLHIVRINRYKWLVGTDTLNYSFSFSDASLYNFTSWDPSGAIVSAGRFTYANAPEVAYQVGSFAAVPDTGSTAALLGVGVFALAAARRRLG